jgi:FxsC-like protein
MPLGRDYRPYFFLSYARTPKRDVADKDDPDRWVYQLYRDLCDVILQLTEVQPEEVGFIDRENRLGSEWSSALVSALQRCRVFVPLYSRRYFESNYCGKEWFAFARREVTNRARGRTDAASAIVPALWTRMDRDRLPRVAQSVQFDHAALGQRYCAEGFYGIMKLQNYRSDYKKAVYRLAERIVEIGDASLSYADDNVIYERTQLDFESFASAFGPDSAMRTTDGQLHISVLAHDTSTLPPDRVRDYYGAKPQDWSPYWPDYPQPIADYTAELGRKCLDCNLMVGSLDGTGPISGRSERPLPPSLCLVDPSVSASDIYREQMIRLNEIEEPWVSVIVPWNSKDRDLSTSENDLRKKLNEYLGRKLASVPRRCAMAADGIPTLQDFGHVLPEMTMAMLKRYRKEAPAHPPAGPLIERARLRRAETEDSGVPNE